LDCSWDLPPTDWIAAFRSVDKLDQDRATEVEKKQATSRAADSKPSLPLEKYAGAYSDAWYGTAAIRLESGALTLSFDHTPGMVGELEHWQYEKFKTHWHNRTIEDAFVTFALNPDGTIEHFKMIAVSPLADFSFDYQDLLFEPVLATPLKK
jgi:hypothetical protein